MRRLVEEKVKAKIEVTGLSVRTWAEQNGFSHGSISNWIKGVRNIKYSNLLRLSEALRCTPEEISEVVIKPDPERRAGLEADREELSALLVYLTEEQRKRVINLVQTLVDANRAAEELIRGE